MVRRIGETADEYARRTFPQQEGESPSAYDTRIAAEVTRIEEVHGPDRDKFVTHEDGTRTLRLDHHRTPGVMDASLIHTLGPKGEDSGPRDERPRQLGVMDAPLIHEIVPKREELRPKDGNTPEGTGQLG